MPLYTKFGDSGRTMLYGGGVTTKSNPRVHAYGSVDELSSLLGVLLTEGMSDNLCGKLRTIQHGLYRAGADLATPYRRSEATSGTGRPSPGSREKQITQEQVEELERWIDDAEARAPPLAHFILPGGTRIGAQLHQARTVCRRAERWACALAERDEVNPACLRYLNRLGDFLFAAARVANAEGGVTEVRAGGRKVSS